MVLFIDGQPVGQHVGMTDAAGLLRYASARIGGGTQGGSQATQQEAGLDLVLSDRVQRELLAQLRDLRDTAGGNADQLRRIDAITALVTSSSRSASACH